MPNSLPDYLAAHPEMCQEVAMAFDIGGGAGAWYVGHMLGGQECVASVHIAIWDKHGMGKSSDTRRSAAQFMQDYRVDRIVAEIPTDNFLAQAYAQRVGMRRVGILRMRPFSDGVKRDVVMFESVKGEL